MWNSRLGCLMPGRMPSPQIMDLIKSSFLSADSRVMLHDRNFRRFRNCRVNFRGRDGLRPLAGGASPESHRSSSVGRHARCRSFRDALSKLIIKNVPNSCWGRHYQGASTN
jgi:hypothetical protein